MQAEKLKFVYKFFISLVAGIINSSCILCFVSNLVNIISCHLNLFTCHKPLIVRLTFFVFITKLRQFWTLHSLPAHIGHLISDFQKKGYHIRFVKDAKEHEISGRKATSGGKTARVGHVPIWTNQIRMDGHRLGPWRASCLLLLLM